ERADMPEGEAQRQRREGKPRVVAGGELGHPPVVAVPAGQGGRVAQGDQANDQHGPRYPPNATGVSQIRTASVAPPPAAMAAERVSCTQRANTSTVTASASAGRVSSRLRPS